MKVFGKLMQSNIRNQLNDYFSGIVTRFPLISAAISSTIFLAICLLVLAVVFLPALRWTSGRSPESETRLTETQQEKQRVRLSDDSEEYDDDEKKPWRTRRRSSAGTSSRVRLGNQRPLASVSIFSSRIPDKVDFCAFYT